MKRIIYLMMALICAVSLNAQVTIGADSDPHGGAVLELKSTNKGLLLPRVSLSNVATYGLSGTASSATGMVVYNTNANITNGNGVGVYVWDGSKWGQIGNSNGSGDNGGTGTPATELPKVTITSDKTPANITTGTAVGLTANVTTTGSNTYQWYKNGVAISNAKNSTYAITSMALGDYYSCVVTNSQGSATASWSVCGANTVDGNWLVFMCHNLGADASLDPFTANVGLYGDMYQWGRPTDGHEKRTSGTTTTLATTNTPTHGNFITITTTDNFQDWRSGGGNTTRWGDGTTAANPKKAANDPCPSGWKVPSQSQWISIYQGGTTNGHPDAAIANSWSWVSTGGGGFKVGSSLFLPAAGRRNSNGAILNTDTNGYYWSSTISSTNSYSLNFNSTIVNPANSTTRVLGVSVRCVADN